MGCCGRATSRSQKYKDSELLKGFIILPPFFLFFFWEVARRINVFPPPSSSSSVFTPSPLTINRIRASVFVYLYRHPIESTIERRAQESVIRKEGIVKKGEGCPSSHKAKKLLLYCPGNLNACESVCSALPLLPVLGKLCYLPC